MQTNIKNYKMYNAKAMSQQDKIQHSKSKCNNIISTVMVIKKRKTYIHNATYKCTQHVYFRNRQLYKNIIIAVTHPLDKLRDTVITSPA